MALYSMKEILADAQKRGYGVGYFNAVNLEMVRAYTRRRKNWIPPHYRHGGGAVAHRPV